MVSDLELLDAWLAGNDQAAAELLGRYFDTLYAFFANKVDDATEDLVQNTLWACVRYRDRFREATSFRAYLLTVARHELFAHLRRERRRDVPFDVQVHSVHDLRPTPSRVVARAEESRVLLEALRRLPAETQLLLELYYWEELTAAELAEAAGVPLGTMKSRVRRAKAQLEKTVREVCERPELLRSTLMNLEAWATNVRAQAGSTQPPSMSSRTSSGDKM